MKHRSSSAALLETLRLARGLTQVDLVRLTSIPQATLSKAESGALDLEPERWQSLADALGVPANAFQDESVAVTPDRIFHRKKRSTPQVALRRIGAELALTRIRLQRLLEAPPTTLQRQDLEGGFVTPQEVAQTLRDLLGIGSDPITSLVELIESTGAFVMRWPLQTVQVDAIAAWPQNAAPLILIGEHVNAERQRFTMAHELGHAIMHDDEATVEQEHEADAFAAELLVPAHRLRQEWPLAPDLDSLLPIKTRWGVSLSALIRRAYDADLIDDAGYRQWNIALSTSGMHRREPKPLQPEHPQSVRRELEAALESGTTIDDLAARARMLTPEFTSTFLEQPA